MFPLTRVPFWYRFFEPQPYPLRGRSLHRANQRFLFFEALQRCPAEPSLWAAGRLVLLGRSWFSTSAGATLRLPPGHRLLVSRHAVPFFPFFLVELSFCIIYQKEVCFFPEGVWGGGGSLQNLPTGCPSERLGQKTKTSSTNNQGNNKLGATGRKALSPIESLRALLRAPLLYIYIYTQLPLQQYPSPFGFPNGRLQPCLEDFVKSLCPMFGG